MDLILFQPLKLGLHCRVKRKFRYVSAPHCLHQLICCCPVVMVCSEWNLTSHTKQLNHNFIHFPLFIPKNHRIFITFSKKIVILSEHSTWNWIVSTNSEKSLFSNKYIKAISGWEDNKFCYQSFWERQVRIEAIERDVSCHRYFKVKGSIPLGAKEAHSARWWFHT